MPKLVLSDRTFEHTDGTWTTIEVHYCHPWENGDRPDVTVIVRTYSRKEGSKGFDLGGKPDCSKLFVLQDMEVTLLWGFLAAAKELMPRQWADYLAGETPTERASREGYSSAGCE